MESGIRMQERLQKIIARAGVTSRRKAEELISTGRVSVNGKVVTELGEKADSSRDSIKVDGKPLKTKEPAQYWLLYKPREVVTTLSDPEGRPSIQEFLRGMRQRLFPVGRLDYHSEGLLLLTNDGELAHKVMHASSHLPKVYLVKVSGRPEEEQLERLRQGVFIDGRRTAPAEIRRLLTAESPSRRRGTSDNPWLEVTLIEGRNQQIRKMFAIIDHPVEKLKRVSIGPLKVGNMKPGEMRPLSPAELAKLRRELEEGATNGERPARLRRSPARSEERSAARSQKSPRRLRDEAPRDHSSMEKRRPQRAGAPRAVPKFQERFEEPKRRALDFDVDDVNINDDSGFDFDRDFNREYERSESRPGARPTARPGARSNTRSNAKSGDSPRAAGTRTGRKAGHRPEERHPHELSRAHGRTGSRPGAGERKASPRSPEARTSHLVTRGGSERASHTSGRSGAEVRGSRKATRGGTATPGKKSFGPKHPGKGGHGGGRNNSGFSGRKGPQPSNRGTARRSPRGRS